jgi:hypothetical protein
MLSPFPPGALGQPVQLRLVTRSPCIFLLSCTLNQGSKKSATGEAFSFLHTFWSGPCHFDWWKTVSECSFHSHFSYCEQSWASLNFWCLLLMPSVMSLLFLCFSYWVLGTLYISLRLVLCDVSCKYFSPSLSFVFDEFCVFCKNIFFLITDTINPLLLQKFGIS